MISTAIIIFREVFEIALLLSVVMAATREINGRIRIMVLGLGAGAAGSGLVAYFAGEISDMAEGVGQEIFNAYILFAAAAMIGWTVIWMSRHARELSRHINRLGHDIAAGEATIYSMAFVIAVAVLREGAEIVLFVHGMIASKQPVSEIVAGSGIGFAGGVAAGLLLYLGIIRISPRYIFGITAWLLIFVASGMASIGAGYMVAAGYFSGLANIIWDSSTLLSENGALGKSLHVLIGYSERPMEIQAIFYVMTLASLATGILLFKAQSRVSGKS